MLALSLSLDKDKFRFVTLVYSFVVSLRWILAAILRFLRHRSLRELFLTILSPDVII